MAGAGLDALMIRDADGKLKDRVGRAGLHLDGGEESPRGSGCDAGTSRRRQVVRRQRQLCASWQCRQSDGEHRHLSRCTTQRWPARDRCRHRQGTLAVVACLREDSWWATRESSPFVETARGRKFDVRFAEANSLRARRRRPSRAPPPTNQSPAWSGERLCPGLTSVSTATPVRETRELEGDDAWATLRRAGDGNC